MNSRSPLETYLAECRDTLRSGSATPETSYYPALKALFDSAGDALKPRVKAIVNLANRGAGLPDGGLFTADQLRSLPAETNAFANAGPPPARGAIEVKSPRERVQAIAAGAQAQGYCRRYRALLVTNLREFLLLKFEDGVPREVERFALADSEAAFHAACAQPRATAERLGARFDDFLARVLRHNAPLADPKDVTWFLASYARDARERLAAQTQLPLLAPRRTALENALGIKFEGDDGEHFFRSTLVQMLFYGVFAAWVLARRAGAAQGPRFDWRTAAWNLHVPMIRALYEQLAQPSRLGALDLIEPLDRAADTLNRVAANDFFQSFDDRHAVQYFYEPFLEAFDPALRRRLGVWYTPEEIVRYMVARVDWALEHELGLPDGLADESVVVLDPCCGTAAYVVEVLRAIERRLAARGASALDAHKLKRAAMQRVYGFELLPAPCARNRSSTSLRSRGASRRSCCFPTNWMPTTAPARPMHTLGRPSLRERLDRCRVGRQRRRRAFRPPSALPATPCAAWRPSAACRPRVPVLRPSPSAVPR
ncbi:MAG: N-6 DNA methylase [Betaproteobacteria bacterium]